MISISRFMRANLDQAYCVCSLRNPQAGIKRPTSSVSTYTHRAWRAASPGEEFWTG